MNSPLPSAPFRDRAFAVLMAVMTTASLTHGEQTGGAAAGSTPSDHAVETLEDRIKSLEQGIENTKLKIEEIDERLRKPSPLDDPSDRRTLPVVRDSLNRWLVEARPRLAELKRKYAEQFGGGSSGTMPGGDSGGGPGAGGGAGAGAGGNTGTGAGGGDGRIDISSGKGNFADFKGQGGGMRRDRNNIPHYDPEVELTGRIFDNASCRGLLVVKNVHVPELKIYTLGGTVTWTGMASKAVDGTITITGSYVSKNNDRSTTRGALEIVRQSHGRTEVSLAGGRGGMTHRVPNWKRLPDKEKEPDRPGEPEGDSESGQEHQQDDPISPAPIDAVVELPESFYGGAYSNGAEVALSYDGNVVANLQDLRYRGGKGLLLNLSTGEQSVFFDPKEHSELPRAMPSRVCLSYNGSVVAFPTEKGVAIKRLPPPHPLIHRDMLAILHRWNPKTRQAFGSPIVSELAMNDAGTVVYVVVPYVLEGDETPRRAVVGIDLGAPDGSSWLPSPRIMVSHSARKGEPCYPFSTLTTNASGKSFAFKGAGTDGKGMHCWVWTGAWRTVPHSFLMVPDSAMEGSNKDGTFRGGPILMREQMFLANGEHADAPFIIYHECNHSRPVTFYNWKEPGRHLHYCQESKGAPRPDYTDGFFMSHDADHIVYSAGNEYVWYNLLGKAHWLRPTDVPGGTFRPVGNNFMSADAHKLLLRADPKAAGRPQRLIVVTIEPPEDPSPALDLEKQTDTDPGGGTPAPPDPGRDRVREPKGNLRAWWKLAEKDGCAYGALEPGNRHPKGSWQLSTSRPLTLHFWSGHFKNKTNAPFHAEVFDLTGKKVVASQSGTRFDIPITPGLYEIRVAHADVYAGWTCRWEGPLE